MQDPNETFNNIEQNTEMALLQSEKIAESVDNLEPIMEGVLVKTDEMVQEMKKNNDKPVNETKIIFEGVEMTEIRGRDGKDGEKGDKGDTGIQGSKGEKGDKGDHGEKGDKGEDGTNGYDGRDGLDGYDGKDGQDGIDGRDGVDGKDGKDGTEIKAEEIKQKLESLEIGLDYEKLSNVPDIAKVARMASSKTVSLIELDDVDYSGLTKTNGKYVLGGGDGTTTTINGLSGAVTLSAGNNVTLNESGNDIEITANFTQEGKYMISGGITWSGTGLIYDVSFLNYFFNGNKTSNPTQVTLDASDPTNNRFDAIVVDEAGTVTAITGTASANPEVPAIPEDQLQVTIILVAAGSTTPTIASEEIYMDDPTTNWTFSTYTTGAPTGSIDFAGVNSPKQGVNDIEASTDSRLGARFVRGTSFDAFQYTMLQVWVRFTGTAVATNKSLNVRFENSAGTLVGSTVNLFSYGLQRGVLNTWQLVVVPISAFGTLPTTVKGLKVIMAGGTVGVVRQWDIDYMLLTDGSTPYTNIPTIAFYKDGTGFATQSGLDIRAGSNVTITPYNDVINQRARYTVDVTIPPVVVPDADYGDITVSGTGTVWTIDNDAVTYAKMQNVTTARIMGRTTAASGNMEELTVGTGLVLGSGSLKNSWTVDTTYSNAFISTLGSAGAALSGATGGTNNFFAGNAAGLNVTTGSSNVFIGNQAGKGPTTGVSRSIFIGESAGNGATSSSFAVFLGRQSGLNVTGASYSIMVGDHAGTGATGATAAVIIGQDAGTTATGATYSQFIGSNAGYTATNASYSNFMGLSSGFSASAANNSNFFGQFAGSTATNAANSNFFGLRAGQAATNASNSIMIGQQAGYYTGSVGSINAANVIYLGQNAGSKAGDLTLDNVTGSKTSILIGRNTSTGGYSNSIAIGDAAVNTATNQMVIGSPTSPITTISTYAGTYRSIVDLTSIASSDKTITVPNTTGTMAIGTATSATTFATPGTSGNVMTSDGTNWTSAAPTGVTTVSNWIAQSATFGTDGFTAATVTTDTTARLGQVFFPFKITANKISIKTGGTVNVAGTFIISLFSEDGQTRLFSVTTATIDTASTIYTTALSAVVINPGLYYLMIQPVSTASAQIYHWQVVTNPFGTSVGLPTDVTSEPSMQGAYTVTADTAPTTLTLASITELASSTLLARFDN